MLLLHGIHRKKESFSERSDREQRNLPPFQLQTADAQSYDSWSMKSEADFGRPRNAMADICFMQESGSLFFLVEIDLNFLGMCVCC